MKESILKQYERVHGTVVDALRKSPIPARLFGPPKGTIPDIREWIISLPQKSKRERDFSGYRYEKIHDRQGFARKSPRVLGKNQSLLIAESSGFEPEAFRAWLPNARVITRTGVVISPDDRIFEQSCSWGGNLFVSDIEFNSLKRHLKGQRLVGSYTTILSRSWSNYSHWFLECLTRLCVLDGLPPMPIILPRNLSAWHKESLSLLGVGENRWVQLDEGCYEVDQLCFPSFAGWTGRPATWAICGLRDKLLKGYQRTTPKKVYISRAGSQHRRVVNEDAIIKALESEGFVVYSGDQMALADKVRLFADAEIIVGVHGAGMTNVVAAQPGTKIIEVFDPAHFVECYCNVAESLDLPYWYMFAENESLRRGEPVRKGYDDISICIDELLRGINAVSAA